MKRDLRRELDVGFKFSAGGMVKVQECHSQRLPLPVNFYFGLAYPNKFGDRLQAYIKNLR